MTFISSRSSTPIPPPRFVCLGIPLATCALPTGVFYLLTLLTGGRGSALDSPSLCSLEAVRHLVHQRLCLCVSSLPMNAKLQTQIIQVIKHAPRLLTSLPQPHSLLLALCFCSLRNAPCMFLVLLICMPRPLLSHFFVLMTADIDHTAVLSCIVLLPSTSTHHQSCQFPLERESSQVDLT